MVGAYAGVRPLISTGDPKKSVDISRRAELYETSSGMLTITGGKLTTWRRMAKQTIDRLVDREGREAPCQTHEIPLGMAASPEDLEAAGELSDEARDQLAFRYGHAARHVLALARERPELGEPIAAGRPDLLAEVVIAARVEQARTLADVLLAAHAARAPRRARGLRARRRAARRRGDGVRARLGARADRVRGRRLARAHRCRDRPA